jgi:hypothetical protein
MLDSVLPLFFIIVFIYLFPNCSILGLFLEGKISPASVVAIYPGVVYHPGIRRECVKKGKFTINFLKKYSKAIKSNFRKSIEILLQVHTICNQCMIMGSYLANAKYKIE